MPAGPRIRSNSEFGLITDNPLTAGALTFNSARLSLFPVVSAAHAVVTLDPRAINGEPEIVIITAHTAAATVATITRGAYGTVARSHPVGTEWIHAPLDEDFIEILTSATRPSDPYAGQPIFQTDTNSFFARNAANTAWANINMYADPPACRVFHDATQNVLDSVDTALVFNTERYDTDNMHSTAVNTGRITINTAGLYLVFTHIAFQTDNDYTQLYGYLRVNGNPPIIANLGMIGSLTDTTAGPFLTTSTCWKFNVNDYVEVVVHQDNTSNDTRTVVNGSVNNAYVADFGATWIGRG